MVFITVAALIIIGIILFELIIFVHEGGHFLSAKKSGVKVNEFALGMGPKIFSFTKGETTYSLRLFPIGGYCAMEGEDEDSPNPRAFNNAKIWKRMIIVIAGAVMNIILGILFMFVIVVQQDTFSSTTIDSFPETSFSANTGLHAGDTIKKVNGYDIFNFRDLTFSIATTPLNTVDGSQVTIYKEDCANALARVYVDLFKSDLDDSTKKFLNTALSNGILQVNAATTKKDADIALAKYTGELNGIVGNEKYDIPEITVKETRQRYQADVVVERNGKLVTLENVDFYTYKSEDSDKPSVAIDFYLKPIEKNIISVVSQTFEQTVSIVRMIWGSLAGLVQGKFGWNDMSGPVGITSAISQVASQGLKDSFGAAVNNIVYMMMIISVNLGIVNMLPFPALDGGRFVFLIIEAIRKKPVPRKYESYINGAGMVILLLFMVIISVKDVLKLIGV